MNSETQGRQPIGSIAHADRELSTGSHQAIVDDDAAAAEHVAKRALAAGVSPSEIVNEGFIAGMARQVGDAFESGEVFLPEPCWPPRQWTPPPTLQRRLGGAAEREEGLGDRRHRQGDVHDIGKAIVIAYLKAHGDEVTDCGRDVRRRPSSPAQERNADIIGMSALLTTTMEASSAA